MITVKKTVLRYVPVETLLLARRFMFCLEILVTNDHESNILTPLNFPSYFMTVPRNVIFIFSSNGFQIGSL